MITQLKCDWCGKLGAAGEISRSHDDQDLCESCMKVLKAGELRQKITDKRAWLESTYLKELRELEEQLAGMEHP